MITATLRHFPPSEWQRPDLVDNAFAVFLDDVREVAGIPLTITSDGRTPEEEAALPGHAEPPESSLHVADATAGLWCRAVDLAWLPSAADRYRLDQAVHAVANGRAVELEFVPFGLNRHIHLGWFRTDRPSVLIFSEV